jgi:hypothetical protein
MESDPDFPEASNLNKVQQQVFWLTPLLSAFPPESIPGSGFTDNLYEDHSCGGSSGMTIKTVSPDSLFNRCVVSVDTNIVSLNYFLSGSVKICFNEAVSKVRIICFIVDITLYYSIFNSVKPLWFKHIKFNRRDHRELHSDH